MSVTFIILIAAAACALTAVILLLTGNDAASVVGILLGIATLILLVSSIFTAEHNANRTEARFEHACVVRAGGIVWENNDTSRLCIEKPVFLEVEW